MGQLSKLEFERNPDLIKCNPVGSTEGADPRVLSSEDFRNVSHVPCPILKGVLDYGVRVYSPEGYASPTPGARNTLKTILPMAYVLDERHGEEAYGETVIEARAVVPAARDRRVRGVRSFERGSADMCIYVTNFEHEAGGPVVQSRRPFNSRLDPRPCITRGIANNTGKPTASDNEEARRER